MNRFPESRSHMQRPGVSPKAVSNTNTGASALALPVLGLGGWSPGSVCNPRIGSPPSCEDSSVSIQASSLSPGPWGEAVPKQLRKSLALPGDSPGTHLEAGEHSCWGGRNEEWAQPGLGKTLAVPIPRPIVLPSHGIPLITSGVSGTGLPSPH